MVLPLPAIEFLSHFAGPIYSRILNDYGPFNILNIGASIPTSSISMMRPNIEVMCIVKFQYATSAMLALPYDHFLVSLLFLDVPITVIVPSLLLTSFLNVFI